jgi:ribosomal protein S12 methylthiotransferase
MKTRNEKRRINVVTMGCSKNLVDSEKLLKQLEVNGLKVTHNSDTQKSDIVLINTCGFISDAKEESIDTILQFAEAKKRGDIKDLYVMGCLSERYKAELENEIPDVDMYFGTNNIVDIIRTIGYDYKANLAGERFLTTPSHFAYLKISEGCDRQCSFCAIPRIRGKHKSEPMDALLRESSLLAEKGVRELILIAQDLTYYGIDLNHKQQLALLLEKLSALKGIEWIRLHYAYPAGFPDDVLRAIRTHDNICKYLDIPFQHISSKVLKNMRRGINSDQTYKLIEKLRKEVPGLALRTTLMVGHPGEGDPEFNELIKFVEDIRFDRLGVFAYSEEEDTYGAKNFKDSIREEIKQERLERVMEIQKSISYTSNLKKTGQEIKVIIDSKESDYYIGRTEADSPEVDNEVLISSARRLKPGQFCTVRITGANEYDLTGEL